MSLIKGRYNKNTELFLMGEFRKNGIIGWRRHYRIIGKPDFAFPKSKLAVFVDGCFWHGCPLHYREPKTRIDFWKDKIETNRKRDKIVARALKKEGWKVIRVWEHQIKKDLTGTVERIVKKL